MANFNYRKTCNYQSMTNRQSLWIDMFAISSSSSLADLIFFLLWHFALLFSFRSNQFYHFRITFAIHACLRAEIYDTQQSLLHSNYVAIYALVCLKTKKKQTNTTSSDRTSQPHVMVPELKKYEIKMSKHAHLTKERKWLNYQALIVSVNTHTNKQTCALVHTCRRSNAHRPLALHQNNKKTTHQTERHNSWRKIQIELERSHSRSQPATTITKRLIYENNKKIEHIKHC